MREIKLINKEIYFDARVIGLTGRLRATIIKDANNKEYPDYILIKGVYNNGREIWIHKSILKDENTKIIGETE